MMRVFGDLKSRWPSQHRDSFPKRVDFSIAVLLDHRDGLFDKSEFVSVHAEAKWGRKKAANHRNLVLHIGGGK